MNHAQTATELPLVSVIIPSYNCELYITETLNSILAQSLKSLEVIVVDDGSTDRTRELVAAYGPPVRLITQQNQRVCAARNRGIREARGQFICLMDHDDYWFPHKLLSQVEALQQHPEIGAVFSPYIRWHQDNNGQFPSPSSYAINPQDNSSNPEKSGWVYHLFLLDCIMLTSSAMFRAEVFERCGLFDEALPYSEDWDLWLRISRVYPLMQLKCPNTLYRQHPQQGNRIVRDIDYRTVLLENAVARWGFCSPDGRCTTTQAFYQQLALYHAEFAGGCLQAQRRSDAINSFFKAWRCHPQQLKYLAYIVAALLGWVPKW